MLRSGQFENLRWDKLAEAHTANWGLLQSKYGLSSQRIIPTASLSELAVKSVQNCRTYLFTDGAKCRNGWQTDGLPGILSAKDLEENLTPALCNHLLITFAYRFLCDNLTPRTLPECLNTIYSCLNDSLRIKYKYEKKEKDKVTGEEKANLVEDKDGTRELKSTFMKPKEQSCRAYDKKINAVFSCYKQQMQDLCRSLSEDQFAGIKRNKWIITNRRLRITRHRWKNTSSRKQKALERRKKRLSDHAFLLITKAVDPTPEIRSDLVLAEKELVARAAEEYAAPNWAYSVSMACTWTNSPLAKKGDCLVFVRDYLNKVHLLNRLTYFLGSSEWGPILFGEGAPGSKRFVYQTYVPVSQPKKMQDEMERWQLQVSSSLMELRLEPSKRAFVSVPYVKDQTYRHPLPPQSYAIIGSNSCYEIPCEVQQMLNSYLVERTFHGYASVFAMECIKRRQAANSFDSHRDQYVMLPTTFRLRAPLLHPAWIQLADYLVGETIPGTTAIPWIEDHIDYWNRFALPILEEHFIQNVWSRYRADNVDVVLSEIKKTLMQDAGEGRLCDQLNFYRLMPVSDNRQKPKKDDIFNEVMKNVYLAGLGFKLGQTDGRWIDLGRATAFEET